MASGPTWVSPSNGISINSVKSFWYSISVCPTQTDRHTDHATCDICSNRPHLCTACRRCDLKKVSPYAQVWIDCDEWRCFESPVRRGNQCRPAGRRLTDTDNVHRHRTQVDHTNWPLNGRSSTNASAAHTTHHSHYKYVAPPYCTLAASHAAPGEWR